MQRKLIRLLVAGMVALAAQACIGGDKKAAGELYAQSETAIEQGRYNEALELLDTLNARYREQTDIRREALGLRARAMEGLAMDSIQLTDIELAAATVAEDSIRELMRHVPAPAPGMEGYWLPKGVDEHAMAATGIQARVNDEGYLYMVACLKGRRIGLNAIGLKAGAETVRSSEISAARCVNVGNSESASFNMEEVAGFGQWLREHPAADRIEFYGLRGTAHTALKAAVRKEIETCAAFSGAVIARRTASIRREKYERMLRAARDQIANYTSPQEQ